MKKHLLIGILQLTSILAFAQQKQIQYLSGTDAAHTVQWDFFCTAGRNSGEWKKIQVPSCWEQQGYGNYNYGRDYKTNGKNARFYDEKGMYKYSFKVPAAWKGKQVNIVFDGSMTDTEVKINGKSAGSIHQGAFYRFKYDISKLLDYTKTNTLEVTVSKMSSDASVNNAERLADYWVFGGIFRPVFLEAMPANYIDYVGIDAKADGSFAMQVWPKGLTKDAIVVTTITDAANKKIGVIKAPVPKAADNVTVNTNISGINTWTSETPNLYTATVVLQDVAGKKLYELKEKFGFRTIEIRYGQGIYINGTQVKFKGVNRHCWWPETARSLSREQEKMDALLLKEMNMNAVRCSHYPPDKYFLELCDSLGIYVLDELAGWQKYYSSKAGEPLVKELVLRDLNHPSIILWDNGNEGGTNKDLDDDFVKWDFQKRPVIHPHHRPGNQFNGIDCNHYEDYYSSQKILNDSLIYMPTEMLHAQDDGGAGAAMEDFWNLHWSAQKSGGVFIWAMVDEAVVRTDLNNALDANGLNANDGILGPHREKEGSFYALREIFSPVQLKLPAQLPAAFNGSIPVENRFHFTNLNQCSFYWALVDFSKPFDRFDGYVVKTKGVIPAPAVAPLQKGELQLSLPADYTNYDALVIVAKDPSGRELYKWTAEVKPKKTQIQNFVTVKNDSTFITETDTVYTIRGGEVTVVLDKKSGNLVTTKNTANDYVLSFNNGPVLVKGTAAVTSSKAWKEGNDAVVEFTYTGDLKYTRWKINSSGWTTLEYEYNATGDLPFAGISFNYPENYILGTRWLGKGPYRQWKNRMAGTPINVWQNIYNNTHTGYAAHIYPEFKGYYGELTWMELSTVEGKLYIASPDTGLFVRLFDFYALSSANKPHPEIPVGNISFLDCIPPIGTKLATGLTTNTRVYGPMSELNHLNGSKKRTLHFYFGLPKTTNAKEQYSRPAIDNVF
ncbi:MAG TPA: glycoside hydrolase family 2 TIM barrel-domain containing protein [Chitinophagaceae bacterium]|nr:glycoside hydrolase family 2 TIM barrel-domain containing protein [Chitinophagaceae bacterium]